MKYVIFTTVINMYKKKITTDEFIKLIVDKELELVGAPIRYDDLIGNQEKYPHWYQDYSFKLDQYLEWKKFYFDHFYDWKPKREKDIKKYFSWHSLQYGLKYDFPYEVLQQYDNFPE
jgi:hypothetical protein